MVEDRKVQVQKAKRLLSCWRRFQPRKMIFLGICSTFRRRTISIEQENQKDVKIAVKTIGNPGSLIV